VRVGYCFGVGWGERRGHGFGEGRGEDAVGEVDAVALWQISICDGHTENGGSEGFYSGAAGVDDEFEVYGQGFNGAYDAAHHADVYFDFSLVVGVFFECCDI
jgi:hypothetical protein